MLLYLVIEDTRLVTDAKHLKPEWHLLKTQSHRHPGGGRDPEPPMVVAFLDSGLRRNDDQGV